MRDLVVIDRFVACLILAIVSLGAPRSNAADVLTPAVQRTLDAAPAALLPLSLEWERARHHERSVEETLKRINYPPIKAGELKPYKVQLRCDRDKYYCHLWRSTVNIKRMYADGTMEMDETTPMGLTEDEASFDGEVCYVGNGVELQKKTGGIPMLRKTPLKIAMVDAASHHYFVPDFLTWAGYDVPRTPTEIQNGVRSRVLVDLASGGLVRQEASPASHSIDIEAADRVIHYDLAPEFGYAVRHREERTKTGALVTEAMCSDFVKLGARNVWLPEKISVAWHTWDTIPDTFENDPILTERFQLATWDIAAIDHSKFVLDYNVPGAAISDAVVKGAEKFDGGYVDYRVPADPKQLDDAIASALGSELRRSRVSLLLIANIVGLFIVVGVVAVKWYRRGAK